MQVPAVCNVRSQSAGCPTSPAIDFLVPGLEGHHFVAWGVDGGIIDVGFFQVPHASDSTSTSVPLPSSWRHLISLNFETNGSTDAEAVTHLAFGGGPHVLLAAATRTALAIFSLEPLMDHVFQADTEPGVGFDHESRPWELSLAVHDELYLVGSIDCCTNGTTFSVDKPEIVSISWTHQLDGVLVSDTAGGLAMWQLKPIGSGFGNKSSAHLSPEISHNPTSQMAVTTPSSATCASLRCAWKTTAPEPQDLLSAGVSIDAPSASAASRGEKNANVWWPENSNLSTTSSTVSVRREKLKHSCNIVSLEWCPGVLRKDVFATDLGASHHAGTREQPQTQESKNSFSPDRKNTNANSDSTNSTVPPIEDHPALMTLGTDKSVRIWVEMLVVHHAPVVVQSSSHKEQQTPVPPTLDSYFAMALVVDAPPAGSGGHSNIFSASTPEKNGVGSGGGSGSAGENLMKSDDTFNSSMIARWVRGSGSMMGRQRRGTTSSEVLWLIIATKLNEEENVDKSRERKQEKNTIVGDTPSSTTKWLVKLYAVRGLSAVVVANVPGSVAGVSSLSGGAGGGKRPQAVLWGQHLWSGADSLNNNPLLLSSFSAWMSAEDDFPMVTCFDITAGIAPPFGVPNYGNGGSDGGSSRGVVDITAAGVTYATVLAENPTSPSTLHQRLDALSSWKAHTAGHRGAITAMAVCRSCCSSSSSSNNGSNSNSIDQMYSSSGVINSALSSSTGGGFDALIAAAIAAAPTTTQNKKLLVATIDVHGSVALWNAQNGIVEFLHSYSIGGRDSSTCSVVMPKCLEWIEMADTASPAPSTSKETGATAAVLAPSSSPPRPLQVLLSNVLIVGAGKRLFALQPSFTPNFSFNDELEVVGEVEGTILSLHQIHCGNSSSNNNLLLVLHRTNDVSLGATTVSSYDSSTLDMSPTHASLFEIKPATSATGGVKTQKCSICLIPHRNSTSMALPSTLQGSITSITPLCSPLFSNSSGGIEFFSLLSLLVGTSTGHVHTLVLPITDSTSSGGGSTTGFNRIEEVSKSINLASASASGSGSTMAVVAVAVDGESGTAAAVVQLNSTGRGNGVRIKSKKSYFALWKVPRTSSLHSNTITSSSPATTTAAVSTTAAVPIKIPVEHSGCSLTWLNGLIVPCVVVGDIRGNMTFFAPVRDAREGWKAIAKVDGAASSGDGDGGGNRGVDVEEKRVVETAVRCLSSGANSGSGPVLAAIGSRVVCASDEVVVDHELKPLSRHLVEVAGPLPQYHPKMLQALLLGGHYDAASAVLRALTTWAPQYLQYQEQQRYYRLYRTTSDLITAGGTGGDTGSTLLDAPTPRAAAELDAAGPPPFPALSLDQFLKSGLANIPAKLVEMAEKTKNTLQIASAAGGISTNSSVQSVTTKLSDLGIATARAPSQNNANTTTTTSASVDMMASGMLDMSAFMGDFGGEVEGALPSLSPTPAVMAAPAPLLGGNAMDTGMLDLAAFGMDMMPPPPPEPEALSTGAPPAAPVNLPDAAAGAGATSIETGALDLSSFGMAFDIPGATVLGAPASVPAMQSLQPSPGAAGTAATSGIPLSTEKKSGVAMLSAPKQLTVSVSELKPFSSDLLTSLHQIVGLIASKEEENGLNHEESDEFSNHRDLSFLRGTASRQTSGAGSTTAAIELLRCRPLQPLPGLTLEETQDVVAIATYFSSDGTMSSASITAPVDEAGAHFLTALNLACSRPFEDPSNMPFTHDYSQNTSAAARGGRVGSSSVALASQASSKSLHKTPSSASTDALLRRSKSVRNAAGVEYTLAPSMSSMASFSSAACDEENEVDEMNAGGARGDASDVLSRRWGLAPGLQVSSLLWAQLTSSPQALLDHALAKIAARDAEITAFLQAEAIAQDPSAADFISNLAKPGGSSFANISSGGGSGPTWPALRAVGVGFWLHDRTLLASTAEALAKSRFAANRNPDDAALFYAALGKKSVLQGLYRTTNQTRQADFLGRDFSQLKHQQAACKNAFVLMGNHRPELAAAFFILGASPGDAVSVCVRELGDVQLALFIARLLHGPGSEAEHTLIERHIVPAVLAVAAEGQEGAENEPSVFALSSASAGGWASAVTAWLLGDSSAFLKSILGLPTSSDFTEQALRDAPEGLAQLLPALELAAKLTPTQSSSELPSIDALTSALQERCATASDALQSAGLPALALQFEAVAAALACQPPENRNSSASSSSGQSLRAAWACAAALLSHPSGTGTSAQTSAIEKQLAALRAVGLDIDKFETMKRMHTLQKAINPTTTPTSSAIPGGGAGGSSLGSMFSPRAAFGGGGGGHSSLLFRQSSFDTTRSTHSMHSSGSGGHPRLSMDGLLRHGSSTHATNRGGAPGVCAGSAQAPAGHHQKTLAAPLPLSEGSIIFQVDSDSLHGVACCPLISPQVLGRPIITATHRHGLLEFAAQAPPPPPPSLHRHHSATLDAIHTDSMLHQHHSGSSHSTHLLAHTEDPSNTDLISESSVPVSPHSPPTSGGNEQSANMFSRFLSQIFDQSSWTLDPMERTHHMSVDGDVGLAVASAMASANSGHISGSPTAAGASSSSPSEKYSFSTSINPQNTRALALAAHSSRQLFLSGCETSGRVQLWQFGGPRPVASFTPVSPNDLSATNQADTGLLSFSFSTRALSKSTSLVGRLGHWGGARCLAFSPNGERFAAVGDGGVVATWRLGGGSHRPTDVDGALCAEWWHHCLSKEGRAVVYIGGGGSVVAVGGKCSSGNIALWDAASPPAEACVGRLKHHSATVNALCTMPGGWLVAAADAGGALSLTDIRMLGGSTGGARTLWSVRASKGAVQSLVMLPLAATDRPRALAMGAASGGSGVLVSGGQDGIVRVWQASSGKLLQSMDGCSTAHQWKSGGGKGLLSLGGGSTSPTGVTGLAVCEEGVVSCGADGTVRLFPLA